MTDPANTDELDGIAVVGLAGRFPGSRNCDEFWENLREGREGLTFFSDEELEDAGCNLGQNRGKRVRSRGVVDGAELFDAAFFGYTPREAEIMDPQQRVFLEVAWTALENAGFDPDRVPGAVGVYAGASINTYYPNNIVSRPDVLGPFGIFPAVALNEKDFLATRVAYKLNLRGPAISVQTACSTSLVAVCNACQSLLSYECDVALAGGVAINFPQCHSYIHEDGGMISEDGHCKPFAEGATGTLFSDGAGVVVLRRLEDAVNSGDKILAVIKGYALNNDGSDKAGFTAPSINGQSEVIQMAQALADFEPDSISYIEAHGTATPLGDPIEIAGLTKAFQSRTDASQFCGIGSVKSNFGHLDVAAGVAGLIKTVLAIHHRELPPTLHYSGPNPNIDFSATPFFVVDKLTEWNTGPGLPRRAGVSSFGIGGTNAHVVLEDAPRVATTSTSRSYQLLPLSGRNKETVDEATRNLGAYIAAHPDVSLADMAYTLQVGRYQFNQRRVVVCRDRDEAIAEFSADRATEHPTLSPGRHNPNMIFMFPGQGSQRVNMGRDLYFSEKLYRDVVDECAVALKPILDLDIREILFPAPENISWAEETLLQTRVTQPALFVTEYALSRLWYSWGIRPVAMIGHSVGEYVAACLAGVFSLEDGLKLIAARGQLIQEQPTGSMMAVMADTEVVQPLLVESVVIAAINAPSLCVISGNHDDIALMEKVLKDAKIECQPLRTSHAFHSQMMQPVLAPFIKVLEGIRLGKPKIPFVSNLTATWITDDEAQDPEYWAQHLRQAVRFSEGAAVLLENAEHQVLLEVGPGATLTSLMRMHPAKTPGHVVAPSLASAEPQAQSDTALLLSTLGRVWQAGVDVDWSNFYCDETRRKVQLPGYPFEHKRFFVEPGQTVHTLGAFTSQDNTEETPAADDVADSGVPGDSVRARIYACLQAVTGLCEDEIGANSTFMELGFDSLLLSRACSTFEQEFQITITLRRLTEELPTVASLSKYLESAVEDSEGNSFEEPSMQPSPEGEEGSEREGILPLIDAQREIWVASHLDDNVSRTYNESRIVDIRGDLQADLLRDSLQEFVDRHDALRATVSDDGVQIISNELQVELTEEMLGDDQQLDGAVRDSINQLFILNTGPLFRFKLYQMGGSRSVLLLVIHHLIADGWSWALLLEELGEIYDAKIDGKSPPPRPCLSFSKYVAWTNRSKQLRRAASDEAYWLDFLSDMPEEIELPSERKRPPEKTYNAARIQYSFDDATLPELKRVARILDCTVFNFLTATFFAWLYRVTGKQDLVVATPTAGQVACGAGELEFVDRLVGHCVNMLPMRVTCDGTEKFEDLLAHVKSRFMDARDHQNVSFSNLISKLGWVRDPSRVPLTSVSLNFGNLHQFKFSGLQSETHLPPKNYNFFDLTVDMLEGDQNITLDCKFNTDLFEESAVEGWLAQWERLLAATIRDSDASISDHDILSNSERDKLVLDWNATQTDYPRSQCLHQILECRLPTAADKVAVTCSGISLTYSELHRRSNQYANALRSRGIGRGQRVGVCVERSTEMIVVLLGILKSGAAYVPLDPSFPAERLRFMAEDAGLAILVSTASLAGIFEMAKDQQVLLDDADTPIDSYSDEPLVSNVEADAGPMDPAYLIYTSGSTGQPKGVVVPHLAVTNFLSSMALTPGMTEEDVLVAVTTLSFDIAVLELYLPLTVGAHLVIASREEAIDGELLKGLLDDNSATMMQATPVTWRLLMEAGWTCSRAFKALVGGETLPADLADQLIETDVELWNMYGPTETTVWSTCTRVSDTVNGITIGTPIANTAVYILDDEKNLCPIGVAGELYIGGDGVALGYWNRPELTADRFIPNPFDAGPDSKMYVTGDKARWLSNGTIEHLGRLDNQIKVRGFRIETGEIEAGIAQHPDIRDVVVVAREDSPGDKRLVAYYDAEKSSDSFDVELRTLLRAKMPEYMIPAHFVGLDKLPRTNNGKIDRKSLPSLDASKVVRHSEIVDPRNETESRLAIIWKDVLGISEVSVEDNFFELGGHSLLAMQVSARVRGEMSVELPLREYFVSPTIEELAASIEQTRDGADVLTSVADVARQGRSYNSVDLAEEREEFDL